ncbi:hypothetical protein [Pectobacterium versatile]|uniref:hypothetical protein n=1 Tax=Pectobacterium versatile TaxID=2488639 RepID=UPI001CD07919|nr:hypothetical protein [Pectobacterium versatile]
MNISAYAKSRLFNSSNAAVELAKKSKNHKHQYFAEKLILKKINKITSTNENYNVEKSIKYSGLIKDLNDLPAAFSSKYNSVSSELNISRENSSKKISDNKGRIDNKPHAMDDICIGNMNDFIRSPQNISDMKKGILDACNKVTNDKNINTKEIRRIVTNLTTLSLLKNDKKFVSEDSIRFLEKNITNKDKFRCFGDKNNFDDGTLQKLKDHVNEISEWAKNLSYN